MSDPPLDGLLKLGLNKSYDKSLLISPLTTRVCCLTFAACFAQSVLKVGLVLEKKCGTGKIGRHSTMHMAATFVEWYLSLLAGPFFTSLAKRGIETTPHFL